MNVSTKKVLLVCWSFPPNPGIGGRRWAKFAKYLQLEGYEVFVIKSSNTADTVSAWASDVDQGKLHTYEIEQHRYIKWLQGGSSILQKTKHRIAKFALNKISKGTIYDASIGVENKFVKLLEQVVSKNKIDKIIVTGAPFNLMYYTTHVLNKFKTIVSIADYRDPWLDAENYGMKNLNTDRKKFEGEKQNRVIEKFTYITSPSAILLGRVSEHSNFKGKFIEIAHAFDDDDFKDSPSKKASDNPKTKLKIVYGGAIYIGVEAYMHNLSKAISSFNQKSETVQIEADFYTDNHKPYEGKFGDINILPAVNQGYFEILENSDLLVVMCAEHNKDFKTTKFFEYLPLKKPLLFIGPDGIVSKAIETEKTGFVLRIGDSLVPIINGLKNYTPNLRIEKHSFRERTKELIQLLENNVTN